MVRLDVWGDGLRGGEEESLTFLMLQWTWTVAEVPNGFLQVSGGQRTISQTAGAEFDERSGQDTCLGAETRPKRREGWFLGLGFTPWRQLSSWEHGLARPALRRVRTGSCCRLPGTCP